MFPFKTDSAKKDKFDEYDNMKIDKLSVHWFINLKR